jgi:hypothetical protein
MEFSNGYSVVRTLEPGRPPWGRWEVYDAGGLLIGVAAEERESGRAGGGSTFTVVHNPSPTPFVLRYSRHLRARGAWWSRGHRTLPGAVAALARHLDGPGRGRSRHFVTQPR